MVFTDSNDVGIGTTTPAEKLHVNGKVRANDYDLEALPSSAMTVNPTDKFLVNRSGSSYNVEQQNLMAQLQDDDLLLVNRNSKSYKITGAEFKDSLSSPPIIQSVTLTEDDPAGARFTSQDFTTTAVMLDNGTPASAKSIRGWVEGSS